MISPVFRVLIGVLWLSAVAQHASAFSELKISVGEISSPSIQAKDLVLTANLSQDKPSLRLQTQLKASSEPWANLSVDCKLIHLRSNSIECAEGLYKSTQVYIPFKLNSSYSPQQTNVGLILQGARFSDERGLHAGEKIDAQVNAILNPLSSAWLDWRWQLEVLWQAGEVFWQPFYMASTGHQLKAQGSVHSDTIMIDQADIQLKNTAKIHASAQLLKPNLDIKNLQLQIDDLDFSQAYPLILKPLLEKTALGDLEMAGLANMRLSIQDSQMQSFHLNLKEVDIEDRKGSFGLYKLNANVPWSYDEPKKIQISYVGGHLLKIPLGQSQLDAELNRYALSAPQLKIALLDSTLDLQNVSAAWVGQQWHWHLGAKLESVSMEKFSSALGWPKMEGEVAATIPQVTYSNGQLSTQGDIQFRVFDGDISIAQLKMQNPLGIAPKLNANLNFARLDLGKLTRTFAFGAIEGKLDGDVKNLELVNWKPVSFDASFKSSGGYYPKKISQRAVENISALGGAGAAAAVQRSLLRFFEQFNYASIGLSCRLRNNLCEMNGVDSTTQGYVIVKGSGIPAITVLGYNRSVSWSELLGRIKRITEGNTPVIK